MNVVERIDKLRMANNWTYYKLAEMSGLPESTIKSLFGKQKSEPTISTIEKIVTEGFKMSLSDFFKDDNGSEETEKLVASFSRLTDSRKELILKLVEELAV